MHKSSCWIISNCRRNFCRFASDPIQSGTFGKIKQWIKSFWRLSGGEVHHVFSNMLSPVNDKVRERRFCVHRLLREEAVTYEKLVCSNQEYADALWKGSNNGGVSAIVDEIPYLTSFLSDRRYGNDFRMLGCIYKTPGFGFAFHLGSPLVHNLSTAILNLAGGDEGSRIEVKWFGTTSSPIGAGTIPDTDSAPLTLENFSGLFVITGSISTLMLLISIMRLIYAKCTELRKADVESVSYSGTDDESSLLQNGIGGNPSPDRQPLHEAGNNNSGGVHMSGENAGDTQPEPVHQNGMHGGPVPAGHAQIEMRNV